MNEKDLTNKMQAYGIPEYMEDGILRYLLNGIEPGSFLMSFLCNDLKGTFANADHINRECILSYLQFFYNCAPSICWGSYEKVNNWITNHSEKLNQIY